MTRTTLAVAADYADALLVARRSKSVVFLLLLLFLLLQVTVFLLYRYNAFHVVSKANPTSTTSASVSVDRNGVTVDPGTTTQPSQAAQAAPLPARSSGFEITLGLYKWVLNVTTFLGVALVIVLAVVLLLTSVIMLVGRLIGVSHVTSAFVWCVFLAVILFPWQSLLNSGSSPLPGSSGVWTASASPDLEQGAYTSPPVKDQKLPGVLFTWTEVEREARFPANHFDAETVLHWMRFVGWPVVAVLMLLTIQLKSGRGLRFALGEADIPVEVNTTRPVTDAGL